MLLFQLPHSTVESNAFTLVFFYETPQQKAHVSDSDSM